jgi:hypothetical protein
MRDIKKLKSEIFNAIFLIKCDFHPGINRRKSAPRTGKNKTNDKIDISKKLF